MTTPSREGARTAVRVTDALLVLLAFALPLSIAASEITLGLAIVAWLVSRPWERRQAPGVRVLAWATVALAASWILSSLTSGVIVASLIKARKLYSIVIVFLVADRMQDETRARRMVSAAFAGGLATSAYAVFRFVRDHQAGKSDAPLTGVFSTAMTSGNVLTVLTVAALGVCLYANARTRRPWLDWPALLVFFGSLAATFRRGSYLGWLAASLLLVLKRRARWWFLVPLAAVLALWAVPHEGMQRAESIVAHEDYTSTGRISLWKSGWAAFCARPVTGWGLEDASGLILRYRRADAQFPAGHFHNNWVQVGATTGAVGLLAFGTWMALAGWFTYRAFRSTRSALAAAGFAAWLAFQVFGLFDWAFGDAEVANQLFLWIGLALAAAGTTPAPERAR